MATTSSSSIQIVNPFEEVVPLSISIASSSAPPLPSTSSDVFINHHRADVKDTLATNICNKLTALGLYVFLVSIPFNWLMSFQHKSEEAMRTTSLHISIFSVNYVESSWCLAELSSILKTSNRIILVFYHVDPSNLRWVGRGKGIYARAFCQHQEKGKYSSRKLDEWKIALEKIYLHFGCVVKDNKDEEMLKNIVNMVSEILEKVPFLVAQKPVGLDDIVQDFTRNIFEFGKSEHKVQIVGIVGMGGAGKP